MTHGSEQTLESALSRDGAELLPSTIMDRILCQKSSNSLAASWFLLDSCPWTETHGGGVAPRSHGPLRELLCSPHVLHRLSVKYPIQTSAAVGLFVGNAFSRTEKLRHRPGLCLSTSAAVHGDSAPWHWLSARPAGGMLLTLQTCSDLMETCPVDNKAPRECFCFVFWVPRQVKSSSDELQ